MDKKKKWTKPKLVVLARSNPEEMVLIPCKGNGQANIVHANKPCHQTQCLANGPS
jgi:hypothetical protein